MLNNYILDDYLSPNFSTFKVYNREFVLKHTEVQAKEFRFNK